MSASSTKRLPWMKFYPVDWRSDALLRSCSPAARGVWIDLMTIMHEAEPYGELRINGAAATPQQLSKLVGINLKTLSGLLSELEKAGVFSRREDGVIYSRRMVRDRDKALKDRQNGEGGGNPALTKGVNPPDNPKPNGGDNATRVGACARDLNAQTLEKEVKKDSEATLLPPEPARELPSANEILWREGLPIIQHLTGKSDAGCRSLLGKMLRDMRNDAPKVLLILQQARSQERMPDPVAWLTKATQNGRQMLPYQSTRRVNATDSLLEELAQERLLDMRDLH